MKFEMNGRTYIIKEVSQEELQKEHGEIDGTFFGLTIPMKQEILLWEELLKEQKRKTLDILIKFFLNGANKPKEKKKATQLSQTIGTRILKKQTKLQTYLG